MKIHFDCTNLVRITNRNLNISEVHCDISFTNRYLTKNGIGWVPVMGEFHFSRYPFSQWEDEILKMKAGGISIISTYLFWIYHEEKENQYNFSNDRDIHQFLDLCNKHGMLVLLRIGPWCHGEVKYGGFPKFIQRRRDKRSNSPKYLQKVRKIFEKYYEQTKDFYYPKGNVIGIQLENEYDGKDKDHIQVLRKLAVDIGFKLPIYTYTAWPVIAKAANNLLPMFGGYPERPWVQNIFPLKTDDRYKIVDSRADDGIGCDLLKPSLNGEMTYDNFPYATCELGCGIQVTEHRRPRLSSNDTYGMLLVCLAKGLNFPGYYMFHGGRNSYGGLYQESKRTHYPNDCPIISYDFQAPISEFGYLRESYHKHKLIHYFSQSFGEEFSLTQSVFCDKTGSEIDYKTSVRINNEGKGYVFINNYQRLEAFKDIEQLSMELQTLSENITLPEINVPSGTLFFYPFHFKINDIYFDYIIAQPICKVNQNGRMKVYFFRPDNRECRFKTDSVIKTQAIRVDGEYVLLQYDQSVPAVMSDACDIYILSQEKALNLWFFSNEIYFSENTIVPYPKQVFELVERNRKDTNITLKQIRVRRMKYDHYLFSHGPMAQYELVVPRDIFNNYDDYKIIFNFVGSVAMVYVNHVLMADCFNYDGTMILGLKRLKEEIMKGLPIIIKISPIDKNREIYFEYDALRDVTSLSIENIIGIKRKIIEK